MCTIGDFMRNIKDSQNFLHSSALVQRILDMSNITERDIVVEIGPGKGIITELLDKKCKKVIAIEYDKKLYEALKQKKFSNAQIINEDFLNFNFDLNNKYKIFSNIPFNMTTEIFNKIFENYELIDDFYIIMQKEAAQRYMGDSLKTFKSLNFKPIYSSEILYEFNKDDFFPMPNVDIVLVHFHKKEYCDIKNAPVAMYLDMLSYIFNENGATFKEKAKSIFTYEQLKRLSKSIKLDLTAKVSSITYEQWIGIFNCYKQFVPEDKKSHINNSFNKHHKEQNKLEKIYRTRA